MKVFVTGATGFIGSAVTTELINAGHSVLALTRSDKSADFAKQLGAEIIRGDLQDLEALKKGASSVDAVAHLGFVHDFTNFAAACETDRQAILALSSALKGTNKPFIASFGTLSLPSDHTATENDFHDLSKPNTSARAKTEVEFLQQAQDGIAVMALRLPPTVHGEGDEAFMKLFIAAARKHGRSVYVGKGTDVWAAVHRKDAAVLYRLALEKPIAGAVLHGIQDEGVVWKEFTTVIGDNLHVPTVSIKREDANAHFGLLGNFVTVNNPVSSAITQKRFNWTPKEPNLIADLKLGHYFADQKPSKFLS